MRTKSVATQILEETEALSNVVTAFSFTPQEISDALEKDVPSVSARIRAMKRIADRGWKLGVRLDPIIDCRDFENRYNSLIAEIFAEIPKDSIHSVSLGPFRLPFPFFKRMEKLYPQEPLFASNFEKRGRSISYKREIENQRLETCRLLLEQHLPPEKYITPISMIHMLLSTLFSIPHYCYKWAAPSSQKSTAFNTQKDTISDDYVKVASPNAKFSSPKGLVS